MTQARDGITKAGFTECLYLAQSRAELVESFTHFFALGFHYWDNHEIPVGEFNLLIVSLASLAELRRM